MWLWIPKPTNLCIDQDDASCRQLKINWAPDSTDGTYYSLGGNDVHLAADDPNSQILVAHEIGHAVMDDVYNDASPPPELQPAQHPGHELGRLCVDRGMGRVVPGHGLQRPVLPLGQRCVAGPRERRLGQRLGQR